MPHVAVVNHVVVSGQCPSTCLPCDRETASLSDSPVIYLQPCELSFLGIQLKVSLKLSPWVHPYQAPFSWHFGFSFSHL